MHLYVISAITTAVKTHFATVQAMWLQPDVFSIIVLHPGHGFATTAGAPFRAGLAAVHPSQQKPISCGSSAAHTWAQDRRSVSATHDGSASTSGPAAGGLLEFHSSMLSTSAADAARSQSHSYYVLTQTELNTVMKHPPVPLPLGLAPSPIARQQPLLTSHNAGA